MGSGLMSAGKLPEWPEVPVTNVSVPWYKEDWSDYYQRSHAAALARMEALVERIRAMNQVWVHPVDCPRGHYARSDDPPRTDTCTCGLSELLAACEKRKS